MAFDLLAPRTHASWDTLMRLMHLIAVDFGGSVHDSRCGKSWDPGQAVCAELYGVDWNDDPRLREDNQESEYEPCPDGAIGAAERILAGECSWAS